MIHAYIHEITKQIRYSYNTHTYICMNIAPTSRTKSFFNFRCRQFHNHEKITVNAVYVVMMVMMVMCGVKWIEMTRNHHRTSYQIHLSTDCLTLLNIKYHGHSHILAVSVLCHLLIVVVVAGFVDKLTHLLHSFNSIELSTLTGQMYVSFSC